MEGLVVRSLTMDDVAPSLAFYLRLLEEGHDAVLEPLEQPNLQSEEKFVRAHLGCERSTLLGAFREYEHIGTLSFSADSRKERRHCGVLGISVDAKMRQQGVGSALLSQFLGWASSHQQLRRVELQLTADNAPALALYQRFGFGIEGRQKEALFKNGIYRDVLQMVRFVG